MKALFQLPKTQFSRPLTKINVKQDIDELIFSKTQLLLETTALAFEIKILFSILVLSTKR